MVRLEATLLDKFVNGSFAGKRVIGNPLKYNIRTKNRGDGWLELVFHPRGRIEEFMSQAIRFINPYLFYITFRFHAEKARDGGKSLYLTLAKYSQTRLGCTSRTKRRVQKASELSFTTCCSDVVFSLFSSDF